MKKILLTITLLFIFLLSKADNKEGIKFENYSWTEIVTKAKKEKKLIFIDCYTSWCGPCKKLSNEIFTLSEVGDVFNKYFINFKIDMEKGDGIMLKKQFHVGAFPTLLWVDSKGNIVHRALGYMAGDKLLANAETALKGGTHNAGLEQRYNKNINNPDVVKVYLNALTATSDSRVGVVTQQYLSIIPKEQYLDKENFEMIATKVRDPFSSIITYIINNRSEFDNKFSKERVKQVIDDNYEKFADSLVSQVKEGKPFDEVLFNKLIALMNERNFESGAEVIENTRIKIFKYMNEWEEYANKIDSLVKAGFYTNLDSKRYRQWYRPVVKSNCKDKAVLLYAIEWVEKCYEMDVSFNMYMYISYWEDKITLLERMDNMSAELNQAKIELALIKKFKPKQEIADKDKIEKLLKIMSFIN